MMKRRSARAGMAAAGLLLAAVWTAAGSGFHAGGRAELSGAVLPLAGASTTIDLFFGWGDVEVSGKTDVSLFPYTLSTQTLAVSVVRGELSLSAEYEFSIVPIGITAATILAKAAPEPWQIPCGSFLASLAVESEARLKGDSFASTPLRAELWARGTAGVGRSLGPLDSIDVGAALEGTLSSPGGAVWPTLTLMASSSLGCATLASETEVSFAGGAHVTTETVSLACSWRDLGLSGEAWCSFSDEPGGVSAGLRIAYEFGSSPLRAFRTSAECAGGVCR